MIPIAYSDLAALAAAVLLAAAGGEAFLKAILAASIRLRVHKAVVATTLAAFATSSPELTVSTVAALAGSPEIGLGDALGSNVVNIALVFGLALMFGSIHAPRENFGQDYRFALLVPVVTLLLAMDGRIERIEGALLLALFVIWLALNLRAAIRHRSSSESMNSAISADPTEEKPGAWTTLALGVFGLAALVGAGRLFVTGATGIAAAFQIDTYVIGVLVVAIGTSLPELVTVILSRIRGHDDVGVGTLIGSNLFNGLAIVGVASSIHPITAPFAEIAITIGFGIAALLLILPNQASLITRNRGLFLLMAYVVFVYSTFVLGRNYLS